MDKSIKQACLIEGWTAHSFGGNAAEGLGDLASPELIKGIGDHTHDGMSGRAELEDLTDNEEIGDVRALERLRKGDAAKSGITWHDLEAKIAAR
eukprot:6462236-Amphidinium_carterae.1